MIIYLVATIFPHSLPFSNQIHLTPPPTNTSPFQYPYIATSSINWNSFSKYMDQHSSSILERKFPTEQFRSFIRLTFKALQSSSSQNSRSQNKPGSKKLHPPWWNSECDKVMNSRNAAFTRFRQCGQITHFLEYQSCNSQKNN